MCRYIHLLVFFIYSLMVTAQEKQPTGNDLFELLDKSASSDVVKKFDQFYDMEVKDGTTRLQILKGIEYRLKNEKIKTIILHSSNSEWSSYSYGLPVGLKWSMKENDVIKLLGKKENGLPYHYDKNLDLDPKYEGDERKLSSIELKYTNYFETDSKEKDDDALLALFLSDPEKFKYLKPGADQNKKTPGAFDKTWFKKQLGDIIQLYVDKKADQLKGNFLYETKKTIGTSKYYTPAQAVHHVVDQYVEQSDIVNKPAYVIVLDELKSPKAVSFPTAVLDKYNKWLSIAKELLTAPWTFENAEVYEGILDKGVTFENKTGQTTSGGFTYYKYPLVDLYIVYKKDHYSIELKIY